MNEQTRHEIHQLGVSKIREVFDQRIKIAAQEEAIEAIKQNLYAAEQKLEHDIAAFNHNFDVAVDLLREGQSTELRPSSTVTHNAGVLQIHPYDGNSKNHSKGFTISVMRALFPDDEICME